MRRTAHRIAMLGIVAAWSAACVEPSPPGDYGDPTSLNSPTTEGGIVAHIDAPRVLSVSDQPMTELVVIANTDGDIEPLEMRVETPEGESLPGVAEGAPGPGQRFVADVPLLHGRNEIRIHLYTADRRKQRRMSYPLTYDGVAPGLRFSALDPGGAPATCAEPQPRPVPATSAVRTCVHGKVTAGGASVAELQLTLDGDAPTIVVLDEHGEFTAELELSPDTSHMLEALATSDDSMSTAVSVTVVQDSTPPQLTVDQAGGPMQYFDEATMALSGTVEDEHGLAGLWIEFPSGGRYDVEPGSPWAAEIQLAEGDNPFNVVAADRAGNHSIVPMGVVRNRLLWLRPPPAGDTYVQLRLDRFALEELLNEEDQRAIEVVKIDIKPSVVSALYAVRYPDMFGVDTSLWGAAEWNMHRLLNMTPDNADLDGTSVQELLAIAGAVGLPAPRLLAEVLEMDVTESFADMEVLSQVLVEQVVATHPNIAFSDAGAPVLALSMYDVLRDLSTLAPRFGPSGVHPGFLTGTSFATVMEPGFQLSLPARSNLIQHDGIDASSGGKDFLFLSDAEQVLEFDFLSDEFSVVGLVDEPKVDLQVVIDEHPSFLPAGTSQSAGADSANPGFARGNSPVWSASPWYAERLLAEMAYRVFRTRFDGTGYQRTLRYDAGAIVDAAVVMWNRGWITITTAGGIGAPPPPLYAWDLLLEVGQVRLHDGGIAEGGANLAFLLEDLDIGITADELIDALRPTMQEQEAELSERLLGNGGLATSAVDLFYVPSSSGVGGFLFFRSPEDNVEVYDYSQPGFYSDAALANKVSTTGALSGTDDVQHEKVAVTGGTTLYFRDDLGDVYRIQLIEVSAEGLQVRVAPEVM